MKTGFTGTYVLTSDQIWLDHQPCGAATVPQTGQTWGWHGDAVRLDGADSPLLLTNEIGRAEMRRRVARVVERKFDLPAGDPLAVGDDDQSSPDGYVLSDGVGQFTLVPIRSPRLTSILWWCSDGVPVQGREYRVVSVPAEVDVVKTRSSDYGGDVICFTHGTRIRTPQGEQAVEHLSVGDMVQTRDDGPQEVLWIGQRRMSGARLYAMPEAQALFNQPEVLVAASDLINDHSVFVDHAIKEVTYVHLLLSRHQVLWANGVATESYHPANTTLKTVEQGQRAKLLELLPDLKRDLHSYGPYARRNLDRSEAAILLHDMV